MEYTELHAHDVPAGVVTTWTATAPAEAWQADPRGISPGHEEHVTAGGSGAWIGSSLRVPYAFDAEVLGRALRAWIARHEVLRTTVVADPDGGWQRETLPAEVIGIESTEVGWLAQGHSMRYIADHFETMNPTTWPHCTFVTVVDPDAEGFFVAMGADHSVMDAYSQLLWFDEIMSLYERAAAGADDEELATAEVGSHVDASHQERTVAVALDRDAPQVARWREFLTADGGEMRFPRFPVPGIETPNHALPQTSLAEWIADAEQASALNGICRALGTSLQSGVLAALSAGMKERFGQDRLRYILPMHTRYDALDAAAVGWYVGLAPLDIDISDVTSVPELVARVHSRVAGVKDLVRTPYPRVAELLGVQDSPRFAVSYVDGRFIPGSQNWDQWQARALRSPAYTGDEVYFWFGRTHDGLNVAARYPATLEAERAVRGLVEQIRTYLAEVTSPEAMQSLEVTA